MQALAKSLDIAVYFEWEAPRSRDGYFMIRGGLEYAVMRGLAFAPYCDVLWMETSRPHVGEAEAFARAVHAVYPHQMLSYNLSPSFNWDASG
jgi:isocitrate lyase